MANPVVLAGLPITFQGAFVANVSATMGWNTSPTTINMTVIEPKTEVEPGPAIFNPSTIMSLEMGKFFSLSLGSFQFGGLLQSLRSKEDVSNGKQIEVRLVDLRELMKRTYLILNPSDGEIPLVVGDRRVIDVFNQLGLFDSGWTSTGMPWGKIVEVLTAPTFFAMQGLHDQFRIDLSELDAKMDPEYRIGGDVLSILEVVQKAATSAALDWFVETTSSTHPLVKIKIVDRSVNSQPQSIREFAESFGYGTVDSRIPSIEIGREWRNEDNCAVLRSANYEFLSKQSLNSDFLERLDLTTEGFGIFVPTETGMRAALSSQEAWEYYMTQSHLVDTGQDTPAFFNSLYDSFDVNYGTIEDIIARGETGGLNPDYYAKRNLPERGVTTSTTSSVNASGEATTNISIAYTEDFSSYATRIAEPQAVLEKNIMIVKIAYEKYRDYANKHYGKTYFYYDSVEDTFVVPEFFEEIDAAYTRDFDNKDGLPIAVAEFFEDNSGYGQPVIGGAIEAFEIRPGRTKAVARYRGIELDAEGNVILIRDTLNVGNVIFDGFNPKDFIFHDGNLYVAANTTNGILTVNPLWEDNQDKFNQDLGSTVEEAFTQGINNGAGLSISDVTRNADFVHNFEVSIHKKAIPPDDVWIPIRSKHSYWKVWKSSKCGAGGLVVNQDTSLHPFNYGGFTAFDQAGFKQVERMGSDQNEADTATIQVAGTPEVTLGASVGFNSQVTSLSSTIGTNGFITTYGLQTFTPRFGETSKSENDQAAVFVGVNKERLAKLNEKILQDLLFNKQFTSGSQDI